MRRPGRLRSSLVLAAIAISALSGACGDDDGDGEGGLDPNRRLIDVYTATVRAIAEDERPLPDSADEDDESDESDTSDGGDSGDDGPRDVFLAARDDAEISAEVQAGIVVELEDWANVRFIDALDEALEERDGVERVRSDGVLIGLGAVSGDDTEASLTADRYESESSTIVYDITLTRRGGEWRVEVPLDGVTVPAP